MIAGGVANGEAGALLLSTRLKDRLIAAGLFASMGFGVAVGLAISVAFWPFAFFILFVWFTSWRYLRLARFVSGWAVFENGVLVRRWGRPVFVPHSFDSRYYLSWGAIADEDSVSAWYSAKVFHPAHPGIEIAAIEARALLLQSALRQGIERLIVPRLRQTWDAGEFVEFGVLRISQEGLAIDNRTRSWADVHGARLRRGKLEILSAPSYGSVRVPVNHISLLPVCLGFISERVPLSGAAKEEIWNGMQRWN